MAFVDPAVSLREAKAAGAADEKLSRIEGDLIVLATPLDVAIGQLKALRGSKALITSTASAMQPLRAAAKTIRFVAGHPFAGLEQSGFAAGTAGLFFRRLWFVDRDEPEIRRMISDAGARQVVIDAAEHDRNLALGSHLPQILSTALASLLADVDPMFIGNGARSLLRLAASPWEVWRPVIEQNRDNIRKAVDELCRRMRDIDEQDFERAQDFIRGSGARPGR